MATRAPRFSPGLSQEDLVRGYKRIGSRRPFTTKDIKKALRPYGLKPSKARKGASDARLAAMAGRAVVRKFKTDEAKKRAAKK